MTEEQALFETVDDPMDLLERMGDTKLPESVWPQTLADLMAVFRAYFERHGDPEKAPARAQDLCVLLGGYLGGRQIYLPRGDRLKTAIRDVLIWSEFTGDNMDELQRRTGLTKARLYEILARQRELHRRRFQGRLFGTEES